MTVNPALDLILAIGRSGNAALDRAESNVAAAEGVLDDILGRGAGDPDIHGYPGQKISIPVKQSGRPRRVKVRVL